MDRHAVYVTATDRAGEIVTFRVGQPTDWRTAQKRWDRLDERRRTRGLTIRANRRTYEARPAGLEVRAVDRHGVGHGAIRHARAMPVPYLAAR